MILPDFATGISGALSSPRTTVVVFRSTLSRPFVVSPARTLEKNKSEDGEDRTRDTSLVVQHYPLASVTLHCVAGHLQFRGSHHLKEGLIFISTAISPAPPRSPCAEQEMSVPDRVSYIVVFFKTMELSLTLTLTHTKYRSYCLRMTSLG